MNQKILNHFLQYSQFTYPGLYEKNLKSLHGDVKDLCLLLRKQLVHRVTLEQKKTGFDATDDDIKRIPWFRQAEDDYFNTSLAILGELFRRDPRGIVPSRKPEDKLVLTCRHTTLLVASALKAKDIPCRVRSGYAPYFVEERGLSSDHWINEYWSNKENRWIIIDVDGSGHNTGFNMFDLPKDAFDYPAKAWLDVRSGKVDGDHFWNAKPATGLKVVGWALFYDYHCLMKNEIPYIHNPDYLYFRWDTLGKKDLGELDNLAKIMLYPDENFEKLVKIWNTNKKFRILAGGLLP